MLDGVARIYAREATKVTTNVQALADGLAKLSQPRAAGRSSGPELDPIAERLAKAIDRVHGGIGQAPKFPNCTILSLIWRGYRRPACRICATPW